MPSQFSTIGFSITSGEDLAALASRVAEDAARISTPPGEYLKWAPPSGEQLWLQITPDGDAMGMNAHFAGKSSIRLAVEARVARPSHTPLDGTFLAWANPPAGAATRRRLSLCLRLSGRGDTPGVAAAGNSHGAGGRVCAAVVSLSVPGRVRVSPGRGRCQQPVAVVHSVGPHLTRRRATQSS